MPLLATTCLHAAGVTVVFVPSDPASGPYPSDALTVADNAQKTGRRVNLPAADCAADRFGCIVQPALNRLDGFNPQPRIRVRFSSAVNPATLPDGTFFVALDNLTAGEIGLNKTGDTIRINEVVYDPATLTAFAQPDSFLDQHRHYALVVTTVSQSGSGAIAAGDGCQILIPLPVGGRDCIQQTTVDLMQLSSVLRAGVDLDGDGSVDPDASRMAYVGHSLGGSMAPRSPRWTPLFVSLSWQAPLAAILRSPG